MLGPAMRRALSLGFLVLGCASDPFYQPCDPSGLCPGDYVCADADDLPLCTTFCTTTGDCAEHGATVFCGRGGVCLVSCTTDADCPDTSYCDVASSACLR